MNFEIINKLFLELSQVTTAVTAREIRYQTALRSILNAPNDTDGTLPMQMRLIAKDALAEEARAAIARCEQAGEKAGVK